MKNGVMGIPVVMIMVIGSILMGCSSSDNSTPPADSTAPSITSVTPAGDVLSKDDAIVVLFSESMDTASLVLGGDLAWEGDTAVWSQTAAENDTVTIQPLTRWTSGQGRSFTVDAADVAGNALSSFSTDFVVPMEFDNFQAAELVIGQPDFVTSSRGLNATKIDEPYGNIAVFEHGMFIGDCLNNRVLGFDVVPQENGAAAAFVLGQPDFVKNDSNTTRDGMYSPQQVSIEGDTMAVADFDNNRVLIYNSIPVNGSALPDVVVGQPDFTSNGTDCDAYHMYYPETAVIAGGRLIVTDRDHNRVLIWNSIPTTNGQAPDMVLGQGDLTSCTQNDENQDDVADDAPTARVMNSPAGVWSDGNRLIVTDVDNHRVLLWNSFPTADFQAADIVLGQADFTLNRPNDSDGNGITDTPDAKTMNFPYDGVWSNGVQIFVADTDNTAC